jgi:hypothetical protein
MAGDLMTVYKRLGGVKWLLKFAEDNPAEFLRQGLSRLFPAAPKDDEPSGGTYNTQINFDSNPIECARRVAFLLATGLHEDPSRITPVETVEGAVESVTPQQACDWREPIGQVLSPEPVEDPAKAEWAASLPLTPEARQDQKLIRETQTATIENYAGSGAEQGLGPVQRQSVERDPRAAQRDRMARRKDLL